MSQVTYEYLMGVRDAREYLNRFKPDEMEMREVLANIKATMRTFGAGPVKDMLKGERDFWINKLKEFDS